MQVGKVVEINPHKGFFIVEIESGAYAVFEILSSIDIAVGDHIRGELDALGGEDLYHVDHGETFEAYGQSGPSSFSACRRLLG